MNTNLSKCKPVWMALAAGTLLAVSATATAGDKSAGSDDKGASSSGSGSSASSGSTTAASNVHIDPYSKLPASIALKGVVRDFIELGKTGGHPDFEMTPRSGFGHYMGMVADQLDKDGKPVFASTGHKVGSNWRDAAGRNRISPKPYIDSRSGDVSGSVTSSEGGALTSAERLNQWYRDVAGVNVSKTVELTMNRQANSNVYTFDDKTDPTYKSLGGFFPIEKALFGNPGGSPDRNFHFTFELDTTFTYEKGKGQVFTFTGDDDVWVFIDGKMVIDVGGVHGATSQSIELDRLNWLVDGKDYGLKFFFAERHRTQSNFRMETTMVLRSVEPPATTALFD